MTKAWGHLESDLKLSTFYGLMQLCQDSQKLLDWRENTVIKLWNYKDPESMERLDGLESLD